MTEAASSGSGGAERSGRPGTVRVASYNLRGLRDDTAAVVDVVRAIDPDVLLLQEIPRHPLSGYRVTDLARRCDLHWSGRTHRLAGTSMLTSMRVIAADTVDHGLPVGFAENPRSWSASVVTRPGGGRLAVGSLHLPLQSGQRVDHVRRVLAAVESGPAAAGVPVVLGGDLNEDEQGPAWQALAARLPQVSAPEGTFPAHHPHRAIDALFGSRDLRVRPGDRAALDPRRVRAASDHWPVWVDVEL
ncbi:endonuclease/exonuclease/phosphatase family protein [Ornithinicoccus halotolerans]|uniref:endonuclease/exonuclease/phosphatase family protein n=1 Tax=Ornithinicoccus halotolerans TaxID=1748220 RepID=UPI0018861646|nr:endonuclease/exonuclease/phosphatase family protein [Ornithinicoccus halotolerans]